MSSVSVSSSSGSGFDIEPIDSGDDVETGVEPEITTRKLNSIKKLISEQDPLMDEEEIANLNFKSATDHLYNVRTESTEWVTLDFEDPNKKYMLNGNAYNAQELVSWCMQHGKDVVKNFKQKQASSSDVWEKFEKSGYKRLNPTVWNDYCNKNGIDNQIPVVFVDKENKAAIKVLDVGVRTGVCRGWELLKNCQGYEKFYGMPELDKCERPPKRQRE
jgi:hypothetical protein